MVDKNTVHAFQNTITILFSFYSCYDKRIRHKNIITFYIDLIEFQVIESKKDEYLQIGPVLYLDVDPIFLVTLNFKCL